MRKMDVLHMDYCQGKRTQIMLPSLFVLVNRVFLDYERRCHTQEHML